MWRRGRRIAGPVLAVLLLAACTPPGLPEPIAPSGTSSVPGTPPDAGTVIIGLTGRAGGLTGFNPYRIADYSHASHAIASLVLPSTFVVGKSGGLEPDTAVIDSATVVDVDPFTVRYVLDERASWSDGTPISAEDFSYLSAQLVAQPAVSATAAYRLVEAVRSSNAGKTVEVQFAARVPQWRTMFSPLVPSHLMKDFPGGWAAALSGGLPVSGNRFRLTEYNSVTGQVTLTRNDKYWGRAPSVAVAILRLGESDDLLAAFGRGDVQALWLTPDGLTADALTEAVPPERRTLVPTPATVQLIADTTAEPTSSVPVRQAIAAAVDVDALSDVLTRGWEDGALAVSSQVRLPGQDPLADPGEPGVGTANVERSADLLAAAGYRRDGLYAARDGRVLRLTLGVPSGDERLAAAARLLQRQLGVAGMEVDLYLDALPALTTRVAQGTLDLALLTVPRGPSDELATATSFSCPVRPGVDGLPPVDPLVGEPPEVGSDGADGSDGPDGLGTEPETSGDLGGGAGDGAAGSGGEGGDSGGSSGEDAAADATEPPADPRDTDGAVEEPAEDPARTGNLSGYCSATVQPILAAAVRGAAAIGGADPKLWSDLPVLPILEPVTLFAVSQPLAAVLDEPRGQWLWSGPLSGLPDWPTP